MLFYPTIATRSACSSRTSPILARRSLGQHAHRPRKGTPRRTCSIRTGQPMCWTKEQLRALRGVEVGDLELVPRRFLGE
jgi:hypothetical protein